MGEAHIGPKGPVPNLETGPLPPLGAANDREGEVSVRRLAFIFTKKCAVSVFRLINVHQGTCFHKPRCHWSHTLMCRVGILKNGNNFRLGSACECHLSARFRNSRVV